MDDQIFLVNLQSARRCMAVSGWHLHRGHADWFSQPLACSLSAAHSLFWTANQKNNLQLAGAYVRQKSMSKFVVAEPMNWAL
jgi:hypothetical protein